MSLWLKEFKKSGKRKFGDRIILDSLDDISDPVQLVRISCKCGNIKKISLYKFIKNKSKTCGECDFYRFQKSNKISFNKLTLLDNPKSIKNFGDTVSVKCDCGKKVNASFRQVFYGRKKSCGGCSVNNFKKKNITKFGELKIINTIELHNIIKFDQKIDVECSCGNKTTVKYGNIVTKNTKTCGECALFKFKKNKIKKFGKLTIINEIDDIKLLSQLVDIKCDCGKKVKKKLFNVTSGHTKSCGMCYESVRSWYDDSKNRLNGVEFPIKSGVIFGFIKNNNEIKSGNTRLDAECPLCGGPWKPLFKDIKRGQSLSCGCSYNRVSTQQKEIGEFISTYCDVKYEKKVKKRNYDIFIPSKNILIEYHGLKWHSNKQSRILDKDKFETAISLGYDMMVIYEDEWKEKQDIIKNILMNKIGERDQKLLRPSKCNIKMISAKKADEFYEKFHYIGKTKAKINIAAHYGNKIIACISFKHPSRQSKFTFELTRMASNSDFRIHGIWSKMFGLFLSKHNPKSVVSFSDNRMFGGNVYQKMGFKMDGDVRPDYYWVSSRKRFHKSKMRKPKECNMTETELRISQGFQKLWDHGKKRWVWCNEPT